MYPGDRKSDCHEILVLAHNKQEAIDVALADKYCGSWATSESLERDEPEVIELDKPRAL